MKRMYAFEEEDDETGEETYFTVELTHSNDGKQITLVILSNEKMSGQTLAKALKDYAKNFEEHYGSGSIGESVN